MKNFDISDELQNKPSAHAKGSDVRVLIASHEKKQSTVLGLLDTGASNNFITKETLKLVDHTTTRVEVNKIKVYNLKKHQSIHA